MATRDIFDCISPIDYRYWNEKVAHYLSENGFTRYKLMVELALVKTLFRMEICDETVVRQTEAACRSVTTGEVYEEEKRIKHDIRALVNCIRKRVDDKAKPFIHMSATSYDISDTANAARYRDVVKDVLCPSLIELEKALIEITLREAGTVQVGRTHGQHAVPITFGFAVAEYVSRLGASILSLSELSGKLTGKFSGAVGAYNASSIIFEAPDLFEREILQELKLPAAEHSTQIVPPEALTRLLFEVALTAGILANLADDMRHLQRTEIGEIGEEFTTAQVGSSTMPQKRNPINFENVKSSWKIVMPRIITVLIDQISEHQRDLTNSASARTGGEMVAYTVSTADRLTGTMRKLRVDRNNLTRNLALQKGMVAAEPLYIMLAALGHPDAHEKVRELTLQAQSRGEPLEKIIFNDLELESYLQMMTPWQRQIISDPSLYTGMAEKKALEIANAWKERLKI